MKTSNKKKIIVSTLALAMGAALAGSISGSVAWYQYSTRTTASFAGTSAGTSRNLQVARTLANPAATDNINDTNWGYHINGGESAEMAPVAPRLNDDGTVQNFASHPVYQYFHNWQNAEASDFFSYDLYFQSIDENGAREAVDVYLTAYELTGEGVNSAEGTIIEEALRVELATYSYDEGESDWALQDQFIISKTEQTTEIEDYLNLNKPGNDSMDHNGFYADDSDGVATKYSPSITVTKAIGDSGAGLFTDPSLKTAAAVDGSGNLTAAGTYYKANGATSYNTKAYNNLLVGDDDPYNFTGKSADKIIISTEEERAVKVTVKVWLEGWQKADAEHFAPREGTDATGYYSDEECETPVANNYHEVSASAGEPGAGLFTDTACTIKAAVDENGDLTADGTYYKKGLNGTTEYYSKGYIWNNNTIGKNFNLNIRFACEADK